MGFECCNVMDYEDAGLVILKESSLIFCWRISADSINKGEMRLSCAELLPLPNVLHQHSECVCSKNEASSYQNESTQIVEAHRINVSGRFMQCTASLRLIHSPST